MIPLIGKGLLVCVMVALVASGVLLSHSFLTDKPLREGSAYARLVNVATLVFIWVLFGLAITHVWALL